MLVHRDYAIRDIASRVFIYDNSIEFTNARRTNGFVPPASRAIRYGITLPVNPQISAVFSRREYGGEHSARRHSDDPEAVRADIGQTSGALHIERRVQTEDLRNMSSGGVASSKKFYPAAFAHRSGRRLFCL